MSFPRARRDLRFAIILLIALVAAPAAAGSFPESAEDEPLLSELADAFRKHCVRVYVHGKSHEGKAPSVGDFAVDIRGERPTLMGGYWWDENHVVVEDPTLQDHFIRSIEIGLPFSDARYRARVAGRFIKLQAMLLEVLPGDGGILPAAFPLEFVDGDVEESLVLSYVWEDGEWRIKADAGLRASGISDAGLETVDLGAKGVFVSEKGEALGLAFGKKLIVGDDSANWSGRELPYTPLFTREDRDAATRDLRARLAEAVLETRFSLRINIDDDDESGPMIIEIDGPPRSRTTEVRAAGLVAGGRHLLVPLALTAEGIARIEDIAVTLADGREIAASFAGAIRDYQAVLVETEEDLPVDNLPRGFAMLNPMLVPEEAFQPLAAADLRPEMEYVQRWRVDYSRGRRREVADYDRWLGTFRGYRGDTVVLTLTNEEDGSLAFDVKGNLVAVALTPRVLQSRDGGEGLVPSRAGNLATPGFRPLDFLYRRLHASEVFDSALAPVAEEKGRRLVDFGVEYQGLDENTARLFAAADATRGGKIGVLVTHVYPDSMADRIGLREHDILLRMFLSGRSEPVELKGGRANSFAALFGLDDMSSDAFAQMFAMMPPPWPSRDNAISSLLTSFGVGRNATVEYMREGELLRAEFTTFYTDPDYKNARKEKFPLLGLTVKPVTYEVRRYFRRHDASGVIVSKVEEGGKSSVAGIHNYLLITHVNRRRVEGPDDFKAKIQAFENGLAPAVELTVEGFGKTRLVKIE